jgi:hypothetical protein
MSTRREGIRPVRDFNERETEFGSWTKSYTDHNETPILEKEQQVEEKIIRICDAAPTILQLDESDKKRKREVEDHRGVGGAGRAHRSIFVV